MPTRQYLVKTFLLLGLVVILGFTGLVLARSLVVKTALEIALPRVTGLPLSLGKLDIGLKPSFVDIEALNLKSPSGFHDTSLVEIPKIRVDYELFGLLKGKAHLKNIEFDMKQFTVVKNEKGQLNLDRLRALQGTQEPSAQTLGAEPKAPAKAIPVQIDVMRLRIGKVVYVDYSSGSPVTKEFPINFNQSFQNITDLNSVVRLIVLKAMVSSGISNLVNFDIGGLEGSVRSLLNTGAGMAGQLAGKGFNTLTENTGVVGKTAKGLTGAVGGLKNKRKIPF